MSSNAKKFGLVVFTAVILGALIAPSESFAHGVLIARRDLPIPEWLFGWGASLVLIASFVGITMAWKTPRFESDSWRSFGPRASRAVVNPVTGLVAGFLGVALMFVVIWSGLSGTEAPDRNFSVTFVFVTFWLGMTVASVLFGDVFRAFNPWRAIARATSWTFARLVGQRAPALLSYPERLGRWPAAFGVFAFGWLELIYGTPGFQAVGLTPYTVAVATIIYSGITFLGMALFGVDKWLERGEIFSVFYNMFSRLSLFEVRDGVLGRRRPMSGLTSWGEVPGSAAVVLVTIGVTVFDGAGEGVLITPTADIFARLTDSGIGPTAALRISNSVFLTATVALVFGLYWLGIYGMHTVRNGLSTAELGRKFAHSFVPIALAYLVAHYFSLFVFAEQAQFGFLLSDPLGNGSNYFGTADIAINYGTVSATAVWYVQVGALVFGHVLALVLGHDRALAVYGTPKLAARSQYWMLSLMVIFTSLGLFLLSQGNS